MQARGVASADRKCVQLSLLHCLELEEITDWDDLQSN